MEKLNSVILKDFAKSERANRISGKWADRTEKEFRILDFKSLRSWNRAQWYWNETISYIDADQYKAFCAKLSDSDLKKLANA